MKALVSVWVFLAALVAAGATHAQSESGSARQPATNQTWPTVPGERHIIARLQGGAAIRLGDPWSSGILAPPWMHAQVGYLFVNAGPLRMGPTLGMQLGFNLGRSGLQGGPSVGWAALVPIGSMLGVLLRLDVPFLLTRGSAVPVYPITNRNAEDPCQPTAVPAPASLPPSTVDAPLGTRQCIGLSPGIELGAALPIYVRTGLAIVPEINFGLYFGASALTYPLIGVGVGLMIDYEVLR